MALSPKWSIAPCRIIYTTILWSIKFVYPLDNHFVYSIKTLKSRRALSSISTSPTCSLAKHLHLNWKPWRQWIWRLLHFRISWYYVTVSSDREMPLFLRKVFPPSSEDMQAEAAYFSESFFLRDYQTTWHHIL